MAEKWSNSHSQCQVCNRCKPPVHCGGGHGRDHPAGRQENVRRRRRSASASSLWRLCTNLSVRVEISSYSYLKKGERDRQKDRQRHRERDRERERGTDRPLQIKYLLKNEERGEGSGNVQFDEVQTGLSVGQRRPSV